VVADQIKAASFDKLVKLEAYYQKKVVGEIPEDGSLVAGRFR
jgi:hypothetical protein